MDKKREYWHCSMWVLGTAAHSCNVTYAFFVNETCYVFFFITVFVGKVTSKVTQIQKVT